MNALQKKTQQIFSLNLDCVKKKLMKPKVELGSAWSEKKVEKVEKQYKAFLVVCYTERGCTPTRDIDIFWHMHILFTQKYHEDCENIFGRYLHHFPVCDT